MSFILRAGSYGQTQGETQEKASVPDRPIAPPSPPQCKCLQKEVRRRRLANGVLVLATQCLECGRCLGNIPKKNQDLSSFAPWDDSLSKRWQEKYESFWSECRQRWQTEREEKDRLWWEKYEKHMASEKWQDLRRRIFKRSNGVCEGCGQKKAIQVHHLTYERLGDEMLFDLVAVCLGCHEKIHGRPIG